MNIIQWLRDKNSLSQNTPLLSLTHTFHKILVRHFCVIDTGIKNPSRFFPGKFKFQCCLEVLIIKQKTHMTIVLSILFTLVGIIALLLIAAIFIKKGYVVQRETVINAPRQKVFDYIRLL